ncbi:helix-turn-helix domain-containing protein [Paraburkholderia dilworthii]|uniref:Helix-turn-helix transcriptional regulator n=1 Tax=Paraburkholderia dilworthii TaxID=948106 RepID=A0ABW9DD30_9BURK
MTRLNTKQILAANLRRLMDASDTLDTQVKVAARAGIAQSTVGRLLRGEVHPQLDQVEAIATAFRITVGELLTDHSSRAESEIPYDKAAYAQLPDQEKTQIAEFIQFVLSRQTTKEEVAPLTVSRETEMEPGLSERLMKAIQRELNDNTLKLGHEREKETTPRASRKRSSSQ